MFVRCFRKSVVGQNLLILPDLLSKIVKVLFLLNYLTTFLIKAWLYLIQLKRSLSVTNGSHCTYTKMKSILGSRINANIINFNNVSIFICKTRQVNRCRFKSSFGYLYTLKLIVLQPIIISPTPIPVFSTLGL